MKEKFERVLVSTRAIKLTKKLEEQYGPLIFHLSGGCCDGSQLMCFSESDFILGDSDIFLTYVGNNPVCISKDQFEYLKCNQILIDAKKGKGGSFSLETSLGMSYTLEYSLSDQTDDFKDIYFT